MVDGRKGIVWVLYVIEMGRALPLDAEVPAKSSQAESVLQRMEKVGRSKRCRVEGELLQARHAGAAIVQEAVERDVDAIVAGVPYQERFGSPSLGETTPYLLKHSPCRVIVYRDEPQGSGARQA